MAREDHSGINQIGDIVFTAAGAGLCYGSCYMPRGAWVHIDTGRNVWYNVVDADFVSGPLNNVTHDGNGKLTVIYAGKYKLDVALTFEVNMANQRFEVGFEISGSGFADAHGRTYSRTMFADKECSIGTTAILDLAAGATIELAVRDMDIGAASIKVDSVVMNCVQVGF